MMSMMISAPHFDFQHYENMEAIRLLADDGVRSRRHKPKRKDNLQRKAERKQKLKERQHWRGVRDKYRSY